MDKKLTICVEGKEHSWCFNFKGDPKYIPEWRADGLEVYELGGSIPAWLPGWAIRPWFAAQSLWEAIRLW